MPPRAAAELHRYMQLHHKIVAILIIPAFLQSIQVAGDQPASTADNLKPTMSSFLELLSDDIGVSSYFRLSSSSKKYFGKDLTKESLGALKHYGLTIYPHEDLKEISELGVNDSVLITKFELGESYGEISFEGKNYVGLDISCGSYFANYRAKWDENIGWHRYPEPNFVLKLVNCDEPFPLQLEQ